MVRGIHIQVVKYHLVKYKAMHPTTNYTSGENYAVLNQPFFRYARVFCDFLCTTCNVVRRKTKSYFGTPLVGTLNPTIDGRGNSCCDL